jgi:hypothetical protein
MHADVNSFLGWLHRVGAGDVADVTEEQVASVFRVGVCKVDKFVYIGL